MKKILSTILALSLLLTMLVGCSNHETDSTTAATEETTTVAEETTAATETTEETTTAAETTEATEEPTEDTEASPLLGTVMGNTYLNPAAGFGCTLDENWRIYSEAETAALMGMTVDMFSDESVKSLIESSGTALIFYAANTAGSNINISLENVGLLGSILSEDAYIDAALLTLDSTLASAGFTDIIVSKGTIVFAGEERSVIALSAEISGVPVYEILIPFVCDGYICNVTITTVYTNTCTDILPSFYSVD